VFLALAPVPTFLVCGLPKKDRATALDSISFFFLLSGIGNNGLWLAYALKIDNMDIVFISFAGKSLAFDYFRCYRSICSFVYLLGCQAID